MEEEEEEKEALALGDNLNDARTNEDRIPEQKHNLHGATLAMSTSGKYYDRRRPMLVTQRIHRIATPSKAGHVGMISSISW